MSHTGKLYRGLRYWNKRGQDNILPPGIADHPVKMVDVNYYLDFIKDKDSKEVEKNIMQLWAYTNLPDGRNTRQFKELKDKLNNWPKKEEAKSKKVK